MSAATGPVEPVLRAAEQAVVIEAVKAHVEGIRPIDLSNNGQLVGHLMAAETLLIKISEAFAPDTPERSPMSSLPNESWTTKAGQDMTDQEVNDARAHFMEQGSDSMEGEWLRRHGLPENYGD